MRNTLILLAVVSVFCISCDKDSPDPDSVIQPVLFEYQYTNHAWVYNHMGWMIDQNGDIRGFSMPEGWNFPDENGYLTKEQLSDNLAKSDTLYGSVRQDKMLQYYEDRFDLLQGRVDTADIFMADAGVSLLSVFVWDSSKNMYKRKTLATKGDIQLTNKSAKAEPVIDWLVSIGRNTDRFYWNY